MRCGAVWRKMRNQMKYKKKEEDVKKKCGVGSQKKLQRLSTCKTIKKECNEGFSGPFLSFKLDYNKLVMFCLGGV